MAVKQLRMRLELVGEDGKPVCLTWVSPRMFDMRVGRPRPEFFERVSQRGGASVEVPQGTAQRLVDKIQSGGLSPEWMWIRVCEKGGNGFIVRMDGGVPTVTPDQIGGTECAPQELWLAVLQ